MFLLNFKLTINLSFERNGIKNGYITNNIINFANGFSTYNYIFSITSV